MTSPQQPATTAMGELTWAQVMPAETYWRELIAKQIESMCEGIVPMYKPCSHCQDAAAIARGENNNTSFKF